jgi:hypothetical protein
MGSYQTPGVYVVEDDSHPFQSAGVPTGIPCFFGFTERGPGGRPIRVSRLDEFYRLFGRKADPAVFPQQFLADAVHGFFLNGGSVCYVCRVNDGEVAKWPVAWVEGVADVAAIRDVQRPEVTERNPSLVRFVVEAISCGSWARGIRVLCTKADDPSATSTQLPAGMVRRFDLTVQQVVAAATPGSPPSLRVVETFSGLSTDPDDPAYFLRDHLVNGASDHVRLAPFDAGDAVPIRTARNVLAVVIYVLAIGCR